MKEIIYNHQPNFFEIVDEGEYKGVKYICINRGIHPAACVICDERFLKRHTSKRGILECISVHGGMSYCGDISKVKQLDGHTGHCFGWEYNRYNDWAGFWTEEENIKAGNHKWTTKELVYDCHRAIDRYLEIMEKDNILDPVTSPLITKDDLKNLGFHSIYEMMKNDEESAFQLNGINDGNKWSIYVDLQTPSLSYARNQSPRRKYEGSILTMEELRMVVDLCDIPIEV